MKRQNVDTSIRIKSNQETVKEEEHHFQNLKKYSNIIPVDSTIRNQEGITKFSDNKHSVTKENNNTSYKTDALFSYNNPIHSFRKIFMSKMNKLINENEEIDKEMNFPLKERGVKQNKTIEENSSKKVRKLCELRTILGESENAVGPTFGKVSQFKKYT